MALRFYNTLTQKVEPFAPLHGYCDHVRAFGESDIRERFGALGDFVLEKIPAVEKPGKLPPFLVPIELGSFFVAATVTDR